MQQIRPMHIQVLGSRGWWPFARERVRLVIDGQERLPAMKVPRHWTLELEYYSLRLSDIERL